METTTLEPKTVRQKTPQRNVRQRGQGQLSEQRFFLLLRVYGTLVLNIIVLWGLIAGLLYGFARLYGLSEKVQIFLVTPCAMLALNGLLRTLTNFLFNPKGQGIRVVKCSQPVANHFAYYLKILAILTAFFVPLAIAFSMADYPAGFVQVIWLVYETAAFGVAVLLFYRRALMRELVPLSEDESALWNLIYRVARVCYPLVALYILTLIILFGIGFKNLAVFLGTSTVLTLGTLALGFLISKYVQLQISRWEQRLIARLEKAEGFHPNERAQEEKQYQAFANSLRFMVRYLLVLIMVPVILRSWRISWDAQLQVATYPFYREISLLTITASLTLFLLSMLLARLVRQILRQRLLTNLDLDRGTQSALSAGIFFLILGIGGYFSLQLVGIDVSAFEWFFGLLGIGLGFGLQSIVANFVSGIVLLLEKPIKTDDVVEIGTTWGTVERIGVRSTTVVDNDNISLIIPNSDFINKEVVNWSHRDTRSRIRIPVGVAYGSDVNLVRKTLLEVGERHGLVLKRPSPEVRFVAFGGSSLDFELQVYISDVGRRQRIVSDLNFSIDAAFRKAQIEIPFPQRDLHVRSSVTLPTQQLPAPVVEPVGVASEESETEEPDTKAEQRSELPK